MRTKRTKKKNTIAILLSAVIMMMTVFVLMPQMTESVYADDPQTSGKCGDSVNWSFDTSTNTLTISGSGDMYDYTDEDWDQRKRQWDRNPISKVIVEQGVTGIGAYAFMGFDTLEEVTLPPSLTKIGAFAFQSCNLKNVVIPESVTHLGAESFRENQNLNDIEIKANISEILPWTFAQCGATNVVISSDSIVRIGDAAFYGCQGSGETPANITLPSKLRVIGNHAFEFANIKHIDLPNTLTTIEQGAFYSAELEDIKIPGSVTSIADNAFAGCDKMQKIVVPDGIVINIAGNSPAEYLLSPVSCVYNGKAQTPSLTIKDSIGDAIDPSNYDLSYANNINAGTATVKVIFKGNYAGNKTLMFKITKAANPLKIKAKTATVKYKKLKKKSQTLAIGKVIKFTKKGQGAANYKKSTVSYTKAKSVKMSKKALKKYKKQLAKKITINAKTGKVTVKKGLKKGTYKVKVKVKAAGNANYNPYAWKTVTLKIKIK